MGVSSDGILCYGFQYYDPETDETPEWLYTEDDGNDFEAAVARLCNIKEPYDALDSKRYDSDPSYKAEWETYWENKKAAVEATGVELRTHCSYDYPMYILAVKETCYSAS